MSCGQVQSPSSVTGNGANRRPLRLLSAAHAAPVCPLIVSHSQLRCGSAMASPIAIAVLVIALLAIVVLAGTLLAIALLAVVAVVVRFTVPGGGRSRG